MVAGACYVVEWLWLKGQTGPVQHVQETSQRQQFPLPQSQESHMKGYSKVAENRIQYNYVKVALHVDVIIQPA